MNNYIFSIATNVTEVRKIFDITQDYLAEMMGVSRPTVVKIEKDPSKMTKALAFAYFCGVTIEINKRIDNVKNIKPSDYKSKKDLQNLSLDIYRIVGSYATFNWIWNISTGKYLPGIANFLLATYIKKQKKSNENSIVNSLKNIEWSEDKSEEVIKNLRNKLNDDLQKIIELFYLDDLDINQFGREIEKAENPDYDLLK